MSMNEKAKALLEAHVQHELDAFRGEAFERWVATEISELLSWLEQVRVHDISSADRVMGVIERCVIEFQVSGGITELAGECTSQVREAPVNESTRLGDIVPASFFEEVTEKLATLERPRTLAVIRATELETYQSVLVHVIARCMLDFTFRPREPGDGRLRMLSQVGVDLARRALPDFERIVAQSLARSLERNATTLAAASQSALLDILDESRVRHVADDLWHQLSSMKLDELFAHVGALDLDELIVIGYEFWLDFRNTTYFRAVTRRVVDHIFDKYGEESVRSLIEDMGVDEAIIRTEVLETLRPYVEHALRTGYLESRIRARLEAFYASETAAELLK